MNRLPQRAYCLLCRQWRQERLCVKRCLPERMPEASQRMVHQEDGSCAWYAAQRSVLRAEQPLPRCPEGRRMTFVHPISAHPSRLAPVRGPGASRVCSTLLWLHCRCATGTGSTCRTHCVRCLPTQTLRELSWPRG